MAEALLKSAAKAASALLADACDSDVRVSEPDAAADDRAQLKELQKLIENASVDALNILGGDAAVDALNIDAPAFCPIPTMAPPPPRMLAAAAAAALKDAADDDSAPMLRVAAAEFVPSRGPSRSTSPQHLRAPEPVALPGGLRGVCPLPMPPPVGTEVLQYGQSVPLAVPPAPPGRAWRLWAARHFQKEAEPLGARPLPRLLERAASEAADSTAFDPRQVLRAQLLRLCKENERAKARHAELQAR